MSPCRWVKLPGGGVAHLNIAADRRLCETCRARVHTLLCDFPADGGTCDRRLCHSCAVKEGDKDFCPHHRKPGPKPAPQPRKDRMTTTQTALFPEDLCHGHHHDNPESRAAFEDLLPHLGRLQFMVLEYIAGRATGATVKTVRRDLGLEHQTASARLTELLAGALIERTGERRDRCALVRVTDVGRRALAGKSTAAA